MGAPVAFSWHSGNRRCRGRQACPAFAASSARAAKRANQRLVRYAHCPGSSRAHQHRPNPQRLYLGRALNGAEIDRAYLSTRSVSFAYRRANLLRLGQSDQVRNAGRGRWRRRRRTRFEEANLRRPICGNCWHYFVATALRCISCRSFENANNRAWFRDPRAFWFRAVFPEP